MNAPLAFAREYHWVVGWSMALGFIIIILLICFFWYCVDSGKIEVTSPFKRFANPFGPFIRWFESWQHYHYRMREMRLRYKMRKGDPEFVRFMEEELGGPEDRK